MWALLLLSAPGAHGATAEYQYDALARLRRVVHDNGIITNYLLDPAGNRTQVDDLPPMVPTAPPGLRVPETAVISFEVNWGASAGSVLRWRGGLEISVRPQLVRLARSIGTRRVRPRRSDLQQTYLVNTYNPRRLTSQTDANGNRSGLRYGTDDGLWILVGDLHSAYLVVAETIRPMRHGRAIAEQSYRFPPARSPLASPSPRPLLHRLCRLGKPHRFLLPHVEAILQPDPELPG